MNEGRVRKYASPLRAEQASGTRRRVLDAAIELFREVDSTEVAIPEVAERAGVSVSTAYRAFPTRQDLLDAVLAELSDRFSSIVGPVPAGVDDLVESTPHAVRAVFDIEPLYRALFATPEGRELHRSTAARRNAPIDALLAGELTDLTPEQLRRFVALTHLVGSSRSALFLKDYEGFEVDDAAAAVRWALSVLVGAVRDPELRAQL
jgi:AcrR family transcriptional regulator